MKYSRILLPVLLLSMMGCASINVQNAVPLPQVPQVTDTVKDYFIQVGDVLVLDLHSSMGIDTNMTHEENTYTVRPDGKVYVPMLQDEVRVAGYTIKEVRANLLNEYSKLAKYPDILLNVRDFAPRTVYVMGEVRGGVGGAVGGDATGLPYTTDLTALRAVASTGYDVYRADLSNIIVVRTQGVEKKPIVVSLNLRDALKNIDMRQDITLMPNDVVFIPKKGIIAVNDFIDQYINKNVPLPGLVYGIGTAYALDSILNDDDD